MQTIDSSPVYTRRCATPILCILSTALPLAEAREIGARAHRFVWPSQPNTGEYITASGGTVTEPSSEESFKSYASASFHSLAVSCSASGLNNDRQNRPGVGGDAYWFDQITISSPTVPEGTIGTADFTLFFEGSMDAKEAPGYASAFGAKLEYRIYANPDSPDGRPYPGIGDGYTRELRVVSSDIEILGPEFNLNQPQHHQIFFRYGQPFDLTISISARGSVWDNFPSSMNASLRLKGWNGFHNIRGGEDAVTDAVVVSQSDFNYANAGTTTFEQWASLYEVNPTSPGEDLNNNGVPNLLEYALGRNPLEPGSPNPVAYGSIIQQGVEYPTIIFTRPIAGARPGDIQYTPERSTTLGGWSETGMVIETGPDGLQQETVTVRSTQPLGSLEGEWMRLKVTKP